MFQEPPRSPEWKSWTWVGIWTLVIYGSIPLARRLQSVIGEAFGRPFFAYLVGFFVLLAVAASLAWVLRRGRVEWTRRGVWLLVVAVAYVAWTVRLMEGAPEESLHFLEYGVLGIVVFRALSHRFRDWAVYLLAALVCTVLGTLDEIVQWLTPGRYWGLQDIGLNAGASSLALVAIAKGFVPPFISSTARAHTFRWLSRLAILQLVVLLFCFSNTPPRIRWMADRFPVLQFLRENESVMTEYGFQFEDPEIGVFYSRFAGDELRRIDSERAQDAASILDRYRSPESYHNFLKKYSPVEDPFVHEARVHLFRRDRVFSRASLYPNDPDRQSYHYNVTFRENRIMEKYFPRTLEASGYNLSQDDKTFLESQLDPEFDYQSRVSQHLIVRYSEGQIRLALAFLILILIGVERWLGRRPVPAAELEPS